MIEIISRAALLLALLALGYGQFGIRRDPSSAFADIVFLGGAALAAVLLGRTIPAVDGEESESGRSRRGSLFGGSLLAVGLVLVALGAALLCKNWQAWFWIGWLLYLAGTTAASVGLGRFDSESRPGGDAWTWPEALALALIVALGTFLRFYRYSDFPAPYSTHAIEEQQTAYGAYQILLHGARPWEFFVDHYVTALALWLSNEPTFETIRIPFTVFSALTIVPVYCLLRQLVRKPAALAGTFLFAISSWNIIYSRAAHNIFLTNFFVVIVLALLVYFGRRRRLAAAPWIGFLCGYTLYSYAGYRGTSVFALLFLGGLIAADGWRWLRTRSGSSERSPRRLRRDLCAAGISVFFIGALAAPIYVMVGSGGSSSYYFEAAQRSLANKNYYTGDTGAFLIQRGERVRNVARIFMHKGDDSLTFNAPDEPMLDPVTATLFVGGLLMAVFYPRRGFNIFFVVMLLLLMLGATVFVQNLDVRRLQGITPFVVLFAALFFDALWQWFSASPRALRLGAAGTAIGLGALALWWNYDVHFHKMADNPHVRQAFKNQYTTLIEFGRKRKTDRNILLLSLIGHYFDKSYYYRSHYSWLIDDTMHGKDLGDLDEILPPHSPAPDRRGVMVIVQKPFEAEAVAKFVAELYPGTNCTYSLDPDNPYIAFSACDLPQPPVARPLLRTLRARYWLSQDTSAAPFLTRDEPFLAYAMVPPSCYDGRTGPYCAAQWEGTFDVPRDGEYHFTVATRGRTNAVLSVDGQPVRDTTLHLAAGPHELRAHAEMPRDVEAGVSFNWIRDGKSDLVPFYRIGAGGGEAAR